jgi:hypothetical protein
MNQRLSTRCTRDLELHQALDGIAALMRGVVMKA